MSTPAPCHVIFVLCLLVTGFSTFISAQTPCNQTQLQQLTEKCFQDQAVEPLDGLLQVQAICSKKAAYQTAFNCIEKTLRNCYKMEDKDDKDIPNMADYPTAINYLCDHQQDINLTCVNSTQLNTFGCIQGLGISYRKSEQYENLTLSQQDCLSKRIIRDCQTESPCGQSSVRVLVNLMELLYPTCFTTDQDLDYLRCSVPGARQFDVCNAREGLTKVENMADIVDMCSMKTAYIRALTCGQTETVTCERVLMVEETTPVLDYNKPMSYLCRHKADLDKSCLRREWDNFENCTIYPRSDAVPADISSLSEEGIICHAINISIMCTDELKTCGQETVEIISNFFKLSAIPRCSLSTEGLDTENSGHLIVSTLTILASF